MRADRHHIPDQPCRPRATDSVDRLHLLAYILCATAGKGLHAGSACISMGASRWIDRVSACYRITRGLGSRLRCHQRRQWFMRLGRRTTRWSSELQQQSMCSGFIEAARGSTVTDSIRLPSSPPTMTLVGLSPSHCARKVRHKEGLSLGRFVNRRRLARALVVLRKDSTSLSQVALDLGFSSQSHFTRLFSTLVGMTPAKYRKTFTPTVG